MDRIINTGAATTAASVGALQATIGHPHSATARVPEVLQASGLAGSATPVMAAVAAVIASLAIRHQISINRRNKRIDIIAGCNARYDAIYDLRLKITAQVKSASEVQAYYGRYWGLKGDQFDYWLAGFVDIETFTDWCFMTLKAFADNRTVWVATEDDGQKIVEFSFEWGWRKVGLDDHQVTNAWFTELTMALMELGANWRAYLEEHGRSGDNITKVKEQARTDLNAILRIIIKKSATYRLKLQHEMSQREYDNSANEFKVLGLTSANRARALKDVDGRAIYWWLRGKSFVGSLLARLWPCDYAPPLEAPCFTDRLNASVTGGAMRARRVTDGLPRVPRADLLQPGRSGQLGLSEDAASMDPGSNGSIPAARGIDLAPMRQPVLSEPPAQ